MIDFDLEIKNLQPINIKDMELNRYRVDDNVRKSLILYNKAIAEIKTNDLKLAIKDLKKALSYNKGFVEGIKFLGLCYVNNKEYRRAEQTFKKLVKYEIYSDLAKEYIKDLIIEKNISKTMDAIRKVKGNLDNSKNKSILTKFLRRKIITGFLILLIIMCGFIIGNWVPLNLQIASEKPETSNKVVGSKEETEEDSQQDSTLPEKNIIAYEDYKNIEKELDNTKSELESYRSKYDTLSMLNEAEEFFEGEYYEKAASTLLSMKNMKLDDESKVKFDKQWSDLKSNALWTIYNKGSKLYKERKYKEALPKLKIASEIDPNLDIMPWVTYQIGVCYKETNDNTNALVFFKKVKDSYPKSRYASSSERMINQIVN